MLVKSGIVSHDLVRQALPSPQRRAQGPYALLECFQEIPCNPCSTSCPFHAILPMEDINDLPRLEADLCTGCGICASVCPGLAIYIIDESAHDGTVSISIPYEFTPLPVKGDRVMGLDRQGQALTPALVKRVVKGKTLGTPLVTLTCPASFIHDLRFFRLLKEGEDPTQRLGDKDQPADKLLDKDDALICRCEGITLGQVRELVRQGYETVDEIKRISRAGMGPCQARTCGPLIASEIARMTGKPIESIEPSAHRPPVKPLPIAFFMEEDE